MQAREANDKEHDTQAATRHGVRASDGPTARGVSPSWGDSRRDRDTGRWKTEPRQRPRRAIGGGKCDHEIPRRAGLVKPTRPDHGRGIVAPGRPRDERGQEGPQPHEGGDARRRRQHPAGRGDPRRAAGQRAAPPGAHLRAVAPSRQLRPLRAPHADQLRPLPHPSQPHVLRGHAQPRVAEAPLALLQRLPAPLERRQVPTAGTPGRPPTAAPSPRRTPVAAPRGRPRWSRWTPAPTGSRCSASTTGCSVGGRGTRAAVRRSKVQRPVSWSPRIRRLRAAWRLRG